MSKVDYFKELAYRLRGLPERERQNILQVYEELFQKAIENGKSEDEIAESLGYPRVPNWSSTASQPPEPAAPDFRYTPPAPAPYDYAPAKQDSGVKAILISIALGFFNLTFVLGPFLAICGVFLAFYVASFVFLVSPLLMVVGSEWIVGTTDFMFNVYAALTLFGLGIMLSALTVWSSKLFFKLTGAYIRFNVKLVKGA